MGANMADDGFETLLAALDIDPDLTPQAAADEPYHQPLRLSAVVHAPLDRVIDVLADNEAVQTLLDNGWLSLTVADPELEHEPFGYDGELSWIGDAEAEAEPVAAGEPATPTVPADD